MTVPQPINELCTRDVLVMEYLDGVKLIDAIKDFYGGVARKRLALGRLLEVISPSLLSFVSLLRCCHSASASCTAVSVAPVVSM